MPEGVVIYKRFGNPHIKLWNHEFTNLFRFQSLNELEVDGNKNDINYVQDLEQNHLNDILTKKILLPVTKIEESNNIVNQASNENPVLQRKPVSIETALIFGETDRFYSVLDSD